MKYKYILTNLDNNKTEIYLDVPFINGNFSGYEEMIILLCPILPSLINETQLKGFVGRYNVDFVEINENY